MSLDIAELLSSYGITTIVVLAWLSLYFILVLWVFLYRYFSLIFVLRTEKRALALLINGKELPKSAQLTFKEQALERKQPMLEYVLNRAIRNATLGLTFLGIVASTAPFIGLFGTVVEILEAFSKLGLGSRATLDVIAPVISKALVATATGILTAIPAYSFHLVLKRKVYELSTILSTQISFLSANKND